MPLNLNTLQKNKFSIALGTDDNLTLKHERFGDSKQFRIVTIEGNTIINTELRNNIFSDPAIENKPPKILEFLHDCDIFVGRSWRAGSFTLFTEHGKIVLLSANEQLDDIISALIREDVSGLKVFDITQQKFVPATRL
jgi:predicted Fe-Mo cluster-binding NifX family protein